MEWHDEGLVVAVRPHGETGAVAEVFTRAHGRHLGLVHGGRSRRLRPALQTCNHVDVVWRARLNEQLGAFTVELRTGYAATVMDRPLPLLGLESLAALAHQLPERDPHPSLFEVTLFVLEFIDDDAAWPALLARWELALLDELGFGLDLSACAATGAKDGLAYVSPRTGRAVTREAGEPYKERLLALPRFLLPGAPATVPVADVLAAFALTGHFLETRVYGPQGGRVPEVRGRLLTRLAAAH